MNKTNVFDKFKRTLVFSRSSMSSTLFSKFSTHCP
jgi:hypothetical protein